MKNENFNIKKLAIIVAIIVLLIIAIIVAVGSEKNKIENEKPFETNILEGEQFATVKQYEGLEISNVKFKIEENMTQVTADVINNTENNIEGQYVNINILDKDGNKINDIGGYIGEVLAGETTKMLASFVTNENVMSNAYDIEITSKKTSDVPKELEDENIQNNANIISSNDTII